MSLIVGEHVTQSYGELDVLKNASFTLAPGDRVGLVGPNGEGKTTLLKIVAGLIEPTDGVVQRRGNLRVGYLPQDPPKLAGTTLWDSLLEGHADLLEMEHQLHELAARLDTDEAIDRYGQLQARFEAAGGYEYENRAKTVLTGLGFPEPRWNDPLDEFSGGQCSRAMLAKLLMQEPEVLLLDEPTNHLDMDNVEWLEKFLLGCRQTLLIVSHDRYFLDKVTTRTWEVAFGQVEAYRGCYSEYLPKREERYRERLREWEAQQKYIAETEEFIRRNLAGQRTKEAQGRRTRLERFLKTDAKPKPRRHETIHVRLTPSARTGDLVLRTADLQAGYEPGELIVDAGELEVRSGRRVGIVGANGCGKTTLLRTLLGDLPALGGEVKMGSNTIRGYLSQSHASLRPDDTLVDSLTCPPYTMRTDAARDLLGMFHFTGDETLKRIKELSGGQRSRVMLAQVSALGANVLMLDEPTNHLDLPSREVLGEALENFEGTVLFVSHDRYLVERLATDIWYVVDGRVQEIPGGWDAYLAWRARHAGPSPDEPVTPQARAKEQRKAAYQQTKKDRRERQRARRRMEALEREITATEESLESLSARIDEAGQAGDLDRIHELGEKYSQAQQSLADLMDEWETLGEQIEQDR